MTWHGMVQSKRQVYVNEFDSCRYSSIKVNESPQTICENVVITTDDPLDGVSACGIRGSAVTSGVE